MTLQKKVFGPDVTTHWSTCQQHSVLSFQLLKRDPANIYIFHLISLETHLKVS